MMHDIQLRRGWELARETEARRPEGLTQAGAPALPEAPATAPAEVEDRPTERARNADRHVGARIRERRLMLGLSQQQLATMIGVTYQQAHKYERGLNRISAGRLFEIGLVLGVPVAWFFEGLEHEAQAPALGHRQRMCLELARNFVLIDNEKHQEALSQMARALAAQSQGQPLD